MVETFCLPIICIVEIGTEEPKSEQCLQAGRNNKKGQKLWLESSKNSSNFAVYKLKVILLYRKLAVSLNNMLRCIRFPYDTVTTGYLITLALLTALKISKFVQ